MTIKADNSKSPALAKGKAAFVCVDSWAGRREFPCRVVGETPKRFRIEVDTPTKLPGADLCPGESRLVPKSSIRFI